MKKLIIVSIMALFAIGISSNSFGQLVPRAITCLPADAFHPIAGTPYVYTITIPTPPTGTKSVLWRVTQDQTFITDKVLVATPELPGTSDYLATAVPPGAYNVLTPGQLTMELTWKSWTYDPLNPIFIIVYAENADGTCNINNMRVYRIEPINAFTLDIGNKDLAGALQAGYGLTPLERCISDVVSAVYNPAAGGSVDYDFGRDTIYYEVVAANWSGQWKPAVQVSALDPEETVISVDWAYVWPSPLTAWVAHPMPLAAGTYTSTDNVEIQGSPAPPSVGAAGQSIFIRLIIDHTVPPLNYQGLTDETFQLAVNGELYEYNTTSSTWVATGNEDVHWNNGVTPPCVLTEDGFTNDYALQTLKARPDIQDATTPPAGDDFLPVTP